MIFGTAARLRRRLYSAGLLHASTLPRPVVSVGNLVLGGAGKTPHVIHLAEWLSSGGRRVAILSRGYGRKSRGVRWVSDGEGRIGTAVECGDEPVLMARRLPGIPVAVAESRAAAGREILQRRSVDVFLLDDGFQHLSLRRDFDLLLVDCERGLHNRRTVPFGLLREPPGHARFADGLVVTKCPDAAAGALVSGTVPVPAGCPRATSRFVPGEVVGADGRKIPDVGPGREIFGFSGIARNGHFRETLAGAGFRVRGFIGFPDHHVYARGDIERIGREAGDLPVITTEKDAVRLPADVPFPVGALRVEVKYLSGWDDLSRAILARIEGAAA